MRQRLSSPTALSVVAIVAGVLVANLLYLSGVLQANPLLDRIDLATGTSPSLIRVGRNTIDPNDGFTAQALGHQAAEQWLHGTVPYWNPYEGVGTPLAGEMQSAALLPLVLLLALSHGLLYMHVILELVAGLATYSFLRRLKRSEAASAMGGLAFALCGTFAWLANAVVNPIAFLPLLLVGVERAYERARSGRPGGFGLVAVALALSIYAGFPEVAFLDGLFVAGWALLRVWQLRDHSWSALLKKLAAGAFVGVLLAAPILVAFAAYLREGDIGGHAGNIGKRALVGIGVSSLLMPYLYGPIFGFAEAARSKLYLLWGGVGGYLPSTTFGLAVLSLFDQRDRLIKWYLATWSLLVVLKTFGFPPVAWVIDLIPGVTSTAFYRYAIVTVEFAVTVLAAFAVDDILDRFVSRAQAVVATVITLAVVAGLSLAALPEVHTLLQAPHPRREEVALASVLSVVWAAGSISALLVAMLLRDRQRQCICLVGLVAVDCFVMFVVPELSTSRISVDLGPVAFLQHNLGLQRFYTLGPIQPNYGSYYDIASIDINDLPIPKGWARYVSSDLDDNVDPALFTGTTQRDPTGPLPSQELLSHLSAYAATGVKYLVESPGVLPEGSSGAGLRRVYRDPLVEILSVPNAAPFFELTSGAACQIVNAHVDGADVRCSTGGQLLRREEAMHGWSAKVNGKPVRITTAESLYQSIPVQAGDNRVVFSYAPRDVGEAWIGCLIGVAVLAISVGLGWRDRRAGSCDQGVRRADDPADLI